MAFNEIVDTETEGISACAVEGDVQFVQKAVMESIQRQHEYTIYKGEGYVEAGV